jgi:6-phosphogluconolactonase (cycloisomerase 2 family)
VQRHRRLRKKIGTLVLYLAGVSAWATLPAAGQSRHFVYLSSATAHTISGFEVSQATDPLTPVAGSPLNTGRDPGVLAFHPSGRFLYAINSGENTVSAFSVDPVSGALTELSASPFAVGGIATPKFIAVESSGKFLYVAGTVTTGADTFTIVSYYAIDAAGFVNSAAEGAASAVLLSPVGMVSKPNDRFLYVAGTSASNNVAILALELDTTTGALNTTHFSTVSGQSASSLALAPAGQFLFIARGGLSQSFIDTYDLPADGGFGQPRTTLSISGASAAPVALATDYSGAHLYAATPGLGLVGFSVDSTSGALTALPAAFVAPPISPTAVMAADPVTQFPNLYYEERAFRISSDGTLTEMSGSPLPVPGSVTGIAAASPVDQLPIDPINPISGPQISLSPSSLQFSEQAVGTVSPLRSVSLMNTGGALLLLSGISLTGADAADFAMSYDCLAAINPNEGCTIAITFQPLFEGAREASLSIVDNAPDSPHSVALAGTAQIPFSFQTGASTRSVTAGQAAQYDLQLVPAAGFIGKVSLACTGAPEQASCEVPPTLDVTGAGPVLFSVQVSTKARSTLMPPTEPLHPSGGYEYVLLAWIPGTVALLLFLLFLLQTRLPAKRGTKFHWAAASLVLCIALTLASCSGSSGLGTAGAATAPTSTSSPAPTPSPAAGTPAGQYSLTVTATYGTVTESIQLSLSVS